MSSAISLLGGLMFGFGAMQVLNPALDGPMGRPFGGFLCLLGAALVAGAILP